MTPDISEQTRGKVQWAYGSHHYVYLHVPKQQREGVALRLEESRALRKALKRAEKAAQA